MELWLRSKQMHPVCYQWDCRQHQLRPASARASLCKTMWYITSFKRSSTPPSGSLRQTHPLPWPRETQHKRHQATGRCRHKQSRRWVVRRPGGISGDRRLAEEHSCCSLKARDFLGEKGLGWAWHVEYLRTSVIRRKWSTKISSSLLLLASTEGSHLTPEKNCG